MCWFFIGYVRSVVSSFLEFDFVNQATFMFVTSVLLYPVLTNQKGIIGRLWGLPFMKLAKLLLNSYLRNTCLY